MDAPILSFGDNEILRVSFTSRAGAVAGVTGARGDDPRVTAGSAIAGSQGDNDAPAFGTVHRRHP